MIATITKHFSPQVLGRHFDPHRDEDFLWTWKIVFNSSYLISKNFYKNKKLVKASLLRHAKKLNIQIKDIVTDYSPHSHRTF